MNEWVNEWIFLSFSRIIFIFWNDWSFKERTSYFWLDCDNTFRMFLLLSSFKNSGILENRLDRLELLENRTCYLTINVLLDIKMNINASTAFSKSGNAMKQWNDFKMSWFSRCRGCISWKSSLHFVHIFGMDFNFLTKLVALI